MNWVKVALLGVALSLAAVAVGCGKSGDEKADKGKEKEKGKEGDKPTSHGEWWCEEHGVPEDECGMCHPKIAEKIKKADQCPNHPNRTKDQCFVCNPDKWPESAARYKAKTGKDAPIPPAEHGNMPTKK